MIAAIYARKSTDQVGMSEEDKSVARQIAHSKAYANRKGWTVDDRFVFFDDGISGAECANRPGFLRLMNALKPRAPFGAIVMSEESRLGRESIETAYALKQLVTAGVRVFFYLEDRERTLDSPMDKVMLSLTTFADELEREKARQRTYDAMRRKAERGHVTGGRVFGYDNVRIEAGHVERRINEAEAVIVRRIFEMCARGAGRITIAKTLNAEGAISPRAQRGRPNAWVDSSIREVLYRDLYRGVIVWNRSQKRNQWGQTAQHARPESEWVRVPAPKLRIVSEPLWTAAHVRLAEARANYLRSTGGRLWGKPKDGTASKYLLTGLSRCGCCGGSFEPEPRLHGKTRVVIYRCAAHKRRGASVCPNGLSVRQTTMEGAVIDALEALMTPAFLDAVIQKLMNRTHVAGPELDRVRTEMQRQADEVRAELDRLVHALAQTGGSRTVAAGIKAREARLNALETELAGLERREDVSQVEVERLLAAGRQKLAEWRTVLRKRTPIARQIVAKLLRDRLVFVPEERNGRLGYRFTGDANIVNALRGVVTAHGKLWRPQRGSQHSTSEGACQSGGVIELAV